MITVTRNNGGISIQGHAGYAPHGQDVVCAAVSTLVQNLVVSISEITTDEIQYDMQPGLAKIDHGKLSEKAQVLVDSCIIGVRMIAEQYPAYVNLVIE